MLCSKKPSGLSMGSLLIVIFLVLIGSALFSGIEAALFSVSLSRAMALERKRVRSAPYLLEIKRQMSKSIIVIVVFNNLVNIMGSILIGFLTSQILGNAWLGAISAVLTFLIIIFGEIIPKSIGENHAEKISLFVAPFLLVMTKVFSPIILLLENIIHHSATKRSAASEEEIKVLSDLGQIEGTIEKDEREMIQNVFRLNDLSATDIMTPRRVIMMLEDKKTLEETKKQFFQSRYSRIPVFHKTGDDIVGVCFRSELLAALAKGEGEKKISDFKHKVLTVSGKAKADYLLLLFQKTKQHLAMVRDNFGTMLGLVTLEDVLEELVGEIVDEHDEVPDTRVKAKNLFGKYHKCQSIKKHP